MPSTGYIQVRAYTSNAQYPLRNVAITITSQDGTAIAMRLTDRSGKITPIPIPVPDKAESQSPDPSERPYAVVNLYARLKGFEQTEAENLQVFAGITTIQNLEMIPLSEFPDQWDQMIIFDTPPQNLKEVKYAADPSLHSSADHRSSGAAGLGCSECHRQLP